MSSKKTICLVRGEKRLLNNKCNARYMKQDATIHEDHDSASEHASLFEDQGTPEPVWSPVFILDITTDHLPKDKDVGFMFGRNEDKCDIVLDDPRVSEMHFAICLKLDAATTLLKNYSRHGTQASFTRQKRTKLIRSSHALLNFETVSIQFSKDLRIQIERHDDPADWVQYLTRQKDATRALSLAVLDLGTRIKSTDASNRPPVYIKGRRLGEGSFAEVFEAVEQYSGEIYAMKLYKPGKIRWREHAMLERLKHDHVVQYIAYMHLPGQSPQLIMEYVKGPNLQNFMDPSNGHPPLTMHESQRLLQQLFGAVAYLHNEGVTHRDIKPANIILLDRGPVQTKLVDFGLATDEDEFDSFCGSPLYVAPEIVNKCGPFTNKVDIFSIGVLALQLFGVSFDVQLRGRSSHRNRPYLDAVLERRRLLTAGTDILPLHIDLGVRLLEDLPHDRPSAQDCLTHAFFWEDHYRSIDEMSGSEYRAPPRPRSHRWPSSQASDRGTDAVVPGTGMLYESSQGPSRGARNDRGQPHSTQHSSSMSGPSDRLNLNKQTHNTTYASRQSEFKRSGAPSPFSSRGGHSSAGVRHRNSDLIGGGSNGRSPSKTGGSQPSSDLQMPNTAWDASSFQNSTQNSRQPASRNAVESGGAVGGGHTGHPGNRHRGDVNEEEMRRAGERQRGTRPAISTSTPGELVLNGYRIATTDNDTRISTRDIYEAAEVSGMTRLRLFNLLRGHGAVIQQDGESWVLARDACFLCEAVGVSPRPLFDMFSLDATILLENYLWLAQELPPTYSLLWLKGVSVMFIPELYSVNLSNLLKAYGISGTWMTGFLRGNAHVEKTVVRANQTKGTYIALRDAYSICLSNGFDTEPVKDIAARCGLVLPEQVMSQGTKK